MNDFSFIFIHYKEFANKQLDLRFFLIIIITLNLLQGLVALNKLYKILIAKDNI